MNCKIFKAQLDDYLDKELKPSELEQVQSHLAACDSCHALWQQEITFRHLLQDCEVPAPAEGFEERMFSVLPKKAQMTPKKVFLTGFGGALAAGVMLMFAAAIFVNPVTQETLIPNITLTMNESKNINMVFNVPEVVAGAILSIQVPDHVDIAGRKGLHKIEWKVALKKGQNLLALPIVARSLGTGEIIAKITYGDQEKVFRMKLDIQAFEQGLLIPIRLDAV